MKKEKFKTEVHRSIYNDYLCAAEYLVEDTFFNGACDAIYFYGGLFCYHEYDIFKHWFKPRTEDVYWYGSLNQKNKLARSLGLLLCAEIAKDLTLEHLINGGESDA